MEGNKFRICNAHLFVHSSRLGLDRLDLFACVFPLLFLSTRWRYVVSSLWITFRMARYSKVQGHLTYPWFVLQLISRPTIRARISTHSERAPMLASYRAESTFEEIPIMLVVLPTNQNILRIDHPIPFFRDLKDATNPDLQVRNALAARIRDACVNVGFFYGLVFLPNSLRPVLSLPTISSNQSRSSRVRD